MFKIDDSYLQEFAKIIGELLSAEVDFVNLDLIRVAGTQRYKNKIGVRVDGGSIYELAIKTGKAYIIDNPRENELCKTCKNINNCEETADISYPIRLGDEILGIMGLVSFDEKGRENLLQNVNGYMQFSQMISGLVSDKRNILKTLKDYLIMIKELELIMESSDQGIILIDNEFNIKHMNKNLKKIISDGNTKNSDKVFDIDILTRVLIEGEKIENEEYLLGKDSFLLTAKPILNGDQINGAVFFLNDFNNVRRLVNDFSNISVSGGFDSICGESLKIKETKKRAMIAAKSDSRILLQGESGTGKELFARAIQINSSRSKGPFISINCAAIPESLLESELFGYTEGAFTGAKKGGKPGKFELAKGGTLFLDEIGDMSLHLQSKLLRVLQEGKIDRIGSNSSIDIDARIICATNKEIEKMISRSEFREDLFYRINVIPLYIPALRERKEDISIIQKFFLNKYNNILKKNIKGFSEEVEKIFLNYNWPGNVRELENAVEYSVHMEMGETIQVCNIHPNILNKYAFVDDYYLKEKSILTLRESEKLLIQKALKTYEDTVDGKQKAADKLGIHITTLYRKLKEYNII